MAADDRQDDLGTAMRLCVTGETSAGSFNAIRQESCLALVSDDHCPTLEVSTKTGLAQSVPYFLFSSFVLNVPAAERPALQCAAREGNGECIQRSSHDAHYDGRIKVPQEALVGGGLPLWSWMLPPPRVPKAR